MELLDFLRILRKRLTMIILLCASATITTGLISYLITDKYKATALILVRPNTNVKLTPSTDNKELLDFPIGGGLSKTEVPSNTYIQIIGSRAVAEMLVHRFDLDKLQDRPADTYSKEFLRSFKKRIRLLLLAAQQIPKHGRFIGPPPPFEEAVEIIEKNISMKPIKDAYQFEITFESNHPKVAADVANGAAALFLEHMSELTTAEGKGTFLFLEERLRKSERELADARQALREFKIKNKTVSFKEETSEEIKLIAELESDLEKKEVRLAGLLKELTPSNPKVKAAQAERDRLVEAVSARKSESGFRPEKEKQLATLQLNVTSAEDLYQLIKKEYENAKLRAGQDQSEIRVVSPAVAPVYPSSPLRGLYVAGAFGISLFSGLGLALLLEYLKGTIQGVENVEKVLQLRVLTTIPTVEFNSRHATTKSFRRIKDLRTEAQAQRESL